MKVSGFSFVRDAVRLDFPVVEAVTSILPVCDEFFIAVGECSDGTVELLESIGSEKLNIIHTQWDPKLFVRGAINAQQTNIALDHCTGDWAFYIQADEVLHEKYHSVVLDQMRKNLDRAEVEGLLFDYVHFWGSYVQGRYRKFDAQIVAAINDALQEADSAYVLSIPARTAGVDSDVAGERVGGDFRLTGHASFDVVAGYGIGGATRSKGFRLGSRIYHLEEGAEPRLLVEGHTVMVTADDDGRPVPLPGPFKKAFDTLLAAEPGGTDLRPQ